MAGLELVPAPVPGAAGTAAAIALRHPAVISIVTDMIKSAALATAGAVTMESASSWINFVLTNLPQVADPAGIMTHIRAALQKAVEGGVDNTRAEAAALLKRLGEANTAVARTGNFNEAVILVKDSLQLDSVQEASAVLPSYIAALRLLLSLSDAEISAGLGKLAEASRYARRF